MLLLLQENTLKSPPSIKYRRAAGERCCKQTAEIEHWHVTLDPSVYHRLYILHRLCLKISPHIQTTTPVCVWGTSARCVHTEEKKNQSGWIGRSEYVGDWGNHVWGPSVNSVLPANQPGRCACGVSLHSRVTVSQSAGMSGALRCCTSVTVHMACLMLRFHQAKLSLVKLCNGLVG